MATLAVVTGLLAASCSADDAPAEGGSTTSTIPTTTAVPVSTVPTTTTLAVNSTGIETVAAGVLTVATDHLRSPFFEVVDGVPVGGFEYDLAKVIATRLGVPAVRVVQRPSLLLPAGQPCACDIVLDQMRISDALAQLVDLSVPYLNADRAALVRTGTSLSTPTAQESVRWGFLFDDDGARRVVGQVIDPVSNPTTFATEATALEALRTGGVDALLLDTAKAMALATGDAGFEVPGRFATGEHYGAMLKLGSTATARINDIVSSLRQDGTLGLLARRYFGADPADLVLLRN